MEEERELTCSPEELKKGKELLRLWTGVTDGLESALVNLKEYNKLVGQLDKDEMDYLKRISNRIIVRLDRNHYEFANT